jgi:hypothetical protein
LKLRKLLDPYQTKKDAFMQQHGEVNWIVAEKIIPAFDNETIQKIIDLNGQIGGGWGRIHQHVSVNEENRIKIEEILCAKGFKILSHSDLCDFRHPSSAC